MSAINQDAQIYANNVAILDFTVTNNDVTPAAALDITGFTVKWAMSKIRPDGTYKATPTLTKTVGSGITIVNTSAGTLKVRLDASDTTNLLGDYHHELELTDGSGDPLIVATGKLTFLRNVANV